MQREIKGLQGTQIFINLHSNQLYTLIWAHGRGSHGPLSVLALLVDGTAKVTDQV